MVAVMLSYFFFYFAIAFLYRSLFLYYLSKYCTFVSDCGNLMSYTLITSVLFFSFIRNIHIFQINN